MWRSRIASVANPRRFDFISIFVHNTGMPESNLQVDTSTPEMRGRQPKGFCPHCEYPIDPGKCPECGNWVSAHRLDAKPISLRRRMWIKRVVYTSLVVGLLYGGQQTYESRFWYRWVSAEYLLAPDAYSYPHFREICRRYVGGELTSDQTQVLAEHCLSLSTIVRSPHPSTDSVIVKFETRAGNWFSVQNNNALGVPVVNVGTETGTLTRLPNEKMTSLPYYAVHCYRVRVGEKLAQGRYRVHGSIPIIVFMEDFGQRQLPIQFSEEIVVRDVPITDFVTPINDMISQQRIDEKCALSICPRDEGDFAVNFCSGKLDFPVVGQLDVRITDADTDILAKSTFHYDGTDPYFVHDMRFRLPPESDPASARIDVSFIPDFFYAFEKRYEECTGFTIEWVGVALPVPGKDDCDVCNCCNKPFIRRPDFVKKWTPDSD